VQDIVLINGPKGIKIPMLHQIDEAFKCTILCKLKRHTEEERVIIGHHEHYNHHLKQITFDKKSAIIAIRD
jgi:hypothetical protein